MNESTWEKKGRERETDQQEDLLIQQVEAEILPLRFWVHIFQAGATRFPDGLAVKS